MQIAVGGCLAQKDRRRDRRARAVGRRRLRHPQHRRAARAAGAGPGRSEAAQVEIAEALETFPSTCPPAATRRTPAWVSISVGCNNTCTFCIVPALRGKETDRRPGDILAEVEALVAEGVQEITLLGQNVNAYGVEFGDRARVREAAAGLRRDRRVWNGSDSPRRTRRTSPTT